MSGLEIEYVSDWVTELVWEQHKPTHKKQSKQTALSAAVFAQGPGKSPINPMNESILALAACY